MHLNPHAQVNDEWILRRLERWGKQDDMPFVGPKKGAILSSLVRQKQPLLAVEVGTMAGAARKVVGKRSGLQYTLLQGVLCTNFILLYQHYQRDFHPA